MVALKTSPPPFAEGGRPGSTPALFKALITEHQFCLFCGAVAEPSAVGPQGSLQWKLDGRRPKGDSGGDDSFIKFWHQSAGGEAEPPDRRGPGFGPGGWGGRAVQQQAMQAADQYSGARPRSGERASSAARCEREQSEERQ